MRVPAHSLIAEARTQPALLFYAYNFSRKLRRELPRKEQEQIIGIINEIAAEREGTA